MKNSPSRIRNASNVYQRELRWFLLPYLIGTLALVGVPALLMLGLAFFTYDAISPPVFAGLINFQDVAAEPQTWIALQNTLYFIFLAVPLRLLLALSLALLLNARRRGAGLFRIAVYLPTTIPDVAYALIWLWIVNPFYGPLNLVLRAIGLPAPDWLTDFNTAKLPFVMMSLLQIGESFVILLAGLHNQPREVHEAAAVDGASRWQQLRYMTLPLLKPWLIIVIVRDVILGFQYTFTPSLIMTGGDPYYATLFTPLLIYEEAFDRFRFGQGAVIMLITFALTAYLLYTLFQLSKGWGYADET
ncbi:MAG: sugar ABC transporter permease [Thermoflexales bacterium]|nr:sugar ABC transporter permease [Thermoflexales bacterium]